jgi:two-component system cell cycle sensor histidine kinase/response regulator CckA
MRHLLKGIVLTLKEKLARFQDIFLFSWRDYIFKIVFSCTLLLGLFPVISSLRMAVETRQWLNVIIYSSMYLTAVVLVVDRKIPVKTKSIIGVTGFFILGLLAMHTLGPVGSGRTLLFTFCIMTSLLLGVRAGLIAMLLTVVVVFYFGWMLSAGRIEWPLILAFSPSNHTTTAITFVYVCAVSSAALSVLVRSLENSNQRLRESSRVLEERETLFRQMFTDGPVVQFIIDGAGGKIVDANNQAVQFYGYQPDQIKGMNIREINDLPEEELSRELATARKSERTHRFFNHKLASGEIRHVEVYSGPVLIHDKEYLLSTIHDVTDRKKAEEEKAKLQVQLQQSQKMEAVGTLAGGISHDFNNILQVINGYTEILLMNKKEGDPEYSGLSGIRRAADRAAELVKQLLLFSRKAETECRSMDINDIVEETAGILHRIIPKMIEIDLQTGADLSKANADPVQVEQILLNLGQNAADAMPDGGRLIIKTENAVLDEKYSRTHPGAKPGQYVLLTVTDTGHGMDKPTLDKIYEPFFTTKEIGKGTGLGLASVYGIIKNHDGYIECRSEVDRGASFRIYLPTTDLAGVETVEVEQTLRPAGGSETVLLVDDDGSIRDIAGQILMKYGYIVITAANGEEALEIVSRRPEEIDLIIMDIGMPGIGGRRCLKELVRINPAVKVLIASGYFLNGEIRETMESGSAGYVGKPYRADELLNKVRAVLDMPE